MVVPRIYRAKATCRLVVSRGGVTLRQIQKNEPESTDQAKYFERIANILAIIAMQMVLPKDSSLNEKAVFLSGLGFGTNQEVVPKIGDFKIKAA